VALKSKTNTSEHASPCPIVRNEYELLARKPANQYRNDNGAKRSSRQYCFKRGQTAINVDCIAASPHQADTPLLARKLSKPSADLKVKLIQEARPNGRVVHALWD
jgi:hypothetical protein